MGIIIFLIVGLIAGLLARAIVPGKDSMGILATLLLGIVGSFIGGALWAVFSGDKILDFNAGGLILSVIGAIIALLIYNRFAGGRARNV
jgi:uncharacterized membrane protein YeaQ/YmgE (transglycosylase-associated protein family)